MDVNSQPSILVRLVHSVPHINVTLNRVNSTFDPRSVIYKESLGILASIPAAILILSLVGLLLYLLTRCCDQTTNSKLQSQACQKFTLISTTLFCCAAIGLGLYGNDDFHNGMLETLHSARQIDGLVSNFTNKTEKLKHDIRSKVLMYDLEDVFERPTFNQTALKILLDNVILVRENTTRAVSSLETILYLIRTPQHHSLKQILGPSEIFEVIRYPVTLGFLAILIVLCVVLVIGVARNSRCNLIFFAVIGLFGIIICWLLSGIYLASSVALGDFCMQPTTHLCNKFASDYPNDVYYLNCGSLRERFRMRLNESRENIEHASTAFKDVIRISKDLYPRAEISTTTDQIENELKESRYVLHELLQMLDQSSVHQHYDQAVKGLCEGALLGLTLMTVAGLAMAFLLTLLIFVNNHTWIYLRQKRKFSSDKAESIPFLNPVVTASPPAPSQSGSSIVNRTLLHHQQIHSTNGVNNTSRKSTTGTMRGLSNGHQTLGRLPSHFNGNYAAGPNSGKYATLSKQCKTLESNDFY
ncbi:protein tweety-2 isoform X2 [Sitodiplosis mosellana]|uniref:protein tweety-2 isoform X2 n=1 Tax=Sitodiplosis mosellana TaxID=263140 RepID=UPI0024447C56|nr:protein tweety-2 isoform X2 [Sitodiplosis mosellana]